MNALRLLRTSHDPRRRYTVSEFVSLPTEGDDRYELEDGLVVVSPPPAPMHMLALGRLFSQMDAQIAADMQVFPEIGVVLSTDPAIVRVPDLVITKAGVDRAAPVVKAEQVLLAVEVVSPGSKRVDTTVKPFEYADAGIPYFWLVDPVPPVTVTAYTLIGDDYEESQRAERVLDVEEPCPLRIDLAKLSR
jgi:Uma2 family endonuclease